VRSLLTAEFPGSLAVRRDYDTSLPELVGDREQLIQAVLNIARNAAQAMNGEGEIVLDPFAAPGHAGQEALPAGHGDQGHRQRAGHSR
jgi:nitrogen-specific signal transduction histidine kinase